MEDYYRNLASLAIENIEQQRALMTNVATGGRRINDVNDQYISRRKEIRNILKKLDLENPNPYEDLWDWYSRWSSGEFPTYISRRKYLRELFSPILEDLESIETGTPPSGIHEPTGWERVDRCVDKMRTMVYSAKNEEDFQQVGLLAREVIITLAQEVYDPEKHKPSSKDNPSETDANGMLTYYISSELRGSVHEELRSFAKSALKLAVSLQHKRTANFRMAAICSEATSALVNIIAIVSDQRKLSTNEQ